MLQAVRNPLGGRGGVPTRQHFLTDSVPVVHKQSAAAVGVLSPDPLASKEVGSLLSH